MKRANASGPFALAIVLLVGLMMLAGCNDDVIYVEDAPPAVPAGVSTVTGDGWVEVVWYPVREADVEGYGVYRSNSVDGRYDRLATVRGIENVSYTDRDVVNGVTYYYAVDAFDERGNESELSYETAFDTPRPAGRNVTVWAAQVDAAHSGLDWSDWGTPGFVSWWNNSNTDLYVQRIDGVLFAKGRLIDGFWNDIQDLGWTASMDDVSWAPEDGWSVAPDGVELIEGHTYVVWTHDSYFAKFRVVDMLSSSGIPSAIVIDWAYQIDQDNPELKARPIRTSAQASERGDAS